MTPTPFQSLSPQARDFSHEILRLLRDPAPVTSCDLLELGKGELDAMVQAICWLGASELIRYEGARWVLVGNENVEVAPSQAAL